MAKKQTNWKFNACNYFFLSYNIDSFCVTLISKKICTVTSVHVLVLV